MKFLERIQAFGHINIQCTHQTTIEITKDIELTRKGDCILGINASKACVDLSQVLKSSIKAEKKIRVTIVVDNLKDFFEGYGNKKLTLSNKNDIVFRKSKYLCDRTILINCTKSSSELPRNLIEVLKENGKEFWLTFEELDENE